MADPLASIETKTHNTPGQNTVAYWMREIRAAEEREKPWRKEAEEAVNLYEAQKSGENSFNVLYSNTETLWPAIYNSLPRPVVDRRYKDEDPLGLNVSQLMKRGLEYCLDTPEDRYTSFNEIVEQAVIGGLVPGRGISRFRYDPELDKAGKEVSAGGSKDPVDQSDVTPSSETPAESPPAGDLAGVPSYESACGINWPYDRFCHGFARRWSDVPWIAYEHRMTKADIIRNFGAQWVERLKVTEEETKKGDGATDDKETKGAPKSAVVYEIWQKSKKKVIFVGRDYKEAVIKTVDDPLGLPGFFDCPQPLRFVNRNSNLVPVVPYKLYEQQAKELNRVTMRINKIMTALKVRGFYNGQIKDLNDLMTMEENRLAPANTNAILAETGGLDKHIWMMPLEKLIQVLDKLYIQREQVKQVIYEITGISDILRGASVASETATAQNIKNQWGTLRLKKMQKQTQEYVRGCMRILAAIMGNHFSQETWAKMTGLKYPTAKERAQAKQVLAQAQMMLQSQQPPPVPGQPPAPPQVPPEMQAKLQELQGIANAEFVWEDLLAVVKDNFQRGYKIDIETNSTVDTDATEDKKNITDLLTAISQSMQAFQPMVESGQLPMGVVKSLLLTITRRFSFGPELEKQLTAMPDQAPPKQDPAMMKVQAEMERDKAKSADEAKSRQLEFALKEKETQQKMALMDKEMEIAEAKLALEREELALKREELGLKQVENQQKRDLNQITHEGKVQTARLKNEQMIMQASMPPAQSSGGSKQ